MAEMADDMNMQKPEEAKKINKQPYKDCLSCGGRNGNAAKKCRNKECGADFIINSTNWDALQKKGKTCRTDQRKKMQMRANVLHSDHLWDIVILGFKRYNRGDSIYSYATPGLAEQFLGKEKEEVSELGKMVIKMLKRFMKENKKDLCNEQDRTEKSHSNKGPVTKLYDSNDSELTTDNNNDDSEPPCKKPCTKNNPVVAYVCGGKVMAVGLVNPGRRIIHGHSIASDCVCVEITFVSREGISAPIVSGNPEENSAFSVGLFFALPMKLPSHCLLVYERQDGNQTNIRLRSYVSTV